MPSRSSGGGEFSLAIASGICEHPPVMPGRIKVLIVDDHPLFRQGLRQVVEADQRFELIGETGDGKSALEMITEKRPDIAVLDVNLPGLTGLEIARRSSF